MQKFSSDFKAVYNAPNETAAWSELEAIKEKWGRKYPYAVSNWENNWQEWQQNNAFIVIQKILKTCITFSDMGIL